MQADADIIIPTFLLEHHRETLVNKDAPIGFGLSRVLSTTYSKYFKEQNESAKTPFTAYQDAPEEVCWNLISSLFYMDSKERLEKLKNFRGSKGMLRLYFVFSTTLKERKDQAEKALEKDLYNSDLQKNFTEAYFQLKWFEAERQKFLSMKNKVQ